MFSNVLGLVIIATATGTNHAHSFHPGEEANGVAWLFRQVFAGSATRDFVHRWFMEELPDVSIGTQSPVKILPDGTKEQTFISSPMTLAQGEIINKWIPIAWPKGHVAIKTFAADVMKANVDGSMPPITPCCDQGPNVASREEVFMHHWTIQKWQLPASAFEKLVEACGRDYDLEFSWKHAMQTLFADAGLNDGANGPCRQAELHLFFGIGNEVRGTPKVLNHSYEFPEPYGIEFDSDRMRKQGEFMLLNTHLIDLRNVTDVRRCAECDCEFLNVKPKQQEYKGGLGCCHSTHFDGGSCPVSESLAQVNQTYHIRYTVTWRDFDSTIKPLEVITFDLTDNNTRWSDISWLPGGYSEEHAALHRDNLSMVTVNDGRSGEMPGGRACHVEYYVPACTPTSRCIHTMHNSWSVPWPMDIVFVRSHFHAGGLNLTIRSDTADICTSLSTYEDRFLIDVSGCKAGKDGQGGLPKPVHLKRDDRVYLEAVYKQDPKPHFGVMAMSFVYAHITPLKPSTVQEFGIHV
jgi:hypothetical protein